MCHKCSFQNYKFYKINKLFSHSSRELRKLLKYRRYSGTVNNDNNSQSLCGPLNPKGLYFFPFKLYLYTFEIFIKHKVRFTKRAHLINLTLNLCKFFFLIHLTFFFFYQNIT